MLCLGSVSGYPIPPPLLRMVVEPLFPYPGWWYITDTFWIKVETLTNFGVIVGLGCLPQTHLEAEALRKAAEANLPHTA